MFWRNKPGKNRNDARTEDELNMEVMPEEPVETSEEELVEEQVIESEKELTREEFIMQNEDAKKVFDSIKDLRKSVEAIKIGDNVNVPSAQNQESHDSEEIMAAKKAVMEKAKEDSENERKRLEEARQRELRIKQEEQKVREAQERAARISAEAERKRLEALEAEKAAREISRKKALETMEAERRAREDALLRNQHSATPEEMNAFFGKENVDSNKKQNVEKPVQVETPEDLSDLKEKLLQEQAKQEKMFGKISQIAGKRTDEIAEVQKAKVDEVAETNRLAKEEQERRLQIQQLRAEQEKAKAEEVIRIKKQEIENAKAERLAKAKAEEAERLAKIEAAKAAKEAKEAAIKAEKAAKMEAAKAAKEAKEAAIKAEKAAKLEAAQAEKKAKKQQQQEAREKRRAERLRKVAEKKRIKREKKRLAEEKLRREEQSKADAEIGGGIVNVNGLQIKTKINRMPSFMWRDFFGFISRRDKKTAVTDEEKQALENEAEVRKEEARRAAVIISAQRRLKYENSKLGRRMNRLKSYCDSHKKGLLTIFAIVIMTVVGAAGMLNYYTAYQYSYNGQVLGIVKSKDDVLKITELVQGALTEEKNMDVVINARDDIEFDWFVISPGNTHIHIDNSEEVLRRLTYMGDLNVKAQGVFVNGKKIGAVADEKTARKVLETIKEKYIGSYEDAKVEKAEIVEDIAIRDSNTNLRDLFSMEEMVDKLCTSGEKKIIHKVVAGDTLHSLAKMYSVDDEQIKKDNPNINSKKLVVGSKVTIIQNAPAVTVRITELVKYDKVVEYKTEKKNDGTIYEGYTERKQSGTNGLDTITARVVTNNGKIEKEDVLKKVVKKEPVTEIIHVGTKERPPTVGSGKYIWPLKSGFRQTSGFQMRWGRMHQGLDLACGTGTDIYAADGGTVIQAGYRGAYGNVIFIDHQNGQETRYAHCSKLLVKPGDKVFQGQVIAKVGNTGRSTGPHLHFEIRIGGNPKNPHNYLP